MQGHGEYECSCRDGFAGPRCESFLEAAKCEAQPFEYSTAVSQRPSPLPTSPSAAFCLNGGRCPFSSTTCECPIGYGGTFLELYGTIPEHGCSNPDYVGAVLGHGDTILKHG